MRRSTALIVLLALLIAACGSSAAQRPLLRLATTTSTEDSGLLRAILPDFEERYAARVDVVAVGTGQALTLARNGDADVVLVHARQQEEEFVRQGYGVARHPVMYNDFVVVGPDADPAGVRRSATATEALSHIAQHGLEFASRGDSSGTHAKERELWRTTGIDPQGMPWYRSLGQGMGETLIFANEAQSYALTDRGTYLSMRDRLPALTILFGGTTIKENSDPTLLNPYGIIAVRSERHRGAASKLATQFIEWLTLPATQQQIAEFGVKRYGQPLFYPETSASMRTIPGIPFGYR